MFGNLFKNWFSNPFENLFRNHLHKYNIALQIQDGNTNTTGRHKLVWKPVGKSDQKSVRKLFQKSI